MKLDLDLRQAFSELALADHLSRLQFALGQLDTRHGHSRQPGFTRQLTALVANLANMGVTNPRHQAWALCFLFESGLHLESIHSFADQDEGINQVLSQALDAGVPLASLKRLQEIFAGLVRYDQPWVSSAPEFFLAPPVLAGKSRLARLQIGCTRAGLVDTADLARLSSQAGYLRAIGGFPHAVFQHSVGGRFTPGALLQQLCSQMFPADNRLVHLSPVVGRCELGVLEAGCFQALQEVQVMDQGQCLAGCQDMLLACPPADLDAFHARWGAVKLFSEARVDMAPQAARVRFEFHAGWEKAGGCYRFETRGEVSLCIADSLLECHAGLLHQGSWVGLRIHSASGVSPHWRFNSSWPEGALPVGKPFVLCRQAMPMSLELLPVMRLGQPALSVSEGLAGELVFALNGQINPSSCRLELDITLSHSALKCHWQAHDVFRGIERGCWDLLEEALIARWSLLDG